VFTQNVPIWYPCGGGMPTFIDIWLTDQTGAPLWVKDSFWSGSLYLRKAKGAFN
jgi:hypothetical protein